MKQFFANLMRPTGAATPTRGDVGGGLGVTNTSSMPRDEKNRRSRKKPPPRRFASNSRSGTSISRSSSGSVVRGTRPSGSRHLSRAPAKRSSYGRVEIDRNDLNSMKKEIQYLRKEACLDRNTNTKRGNARRNGSMRTVGGTHIEGRNRGDAKKTAASSADGNNTKNGTTGDSATFYDTAGDTAKLFSKDGSSKSGSSGESAGSSRQLREQTSHNIESHIYTSDADASGIDLAATDSEHNTDGDEDGSIRRDLGEDTDDYDNNNDLSGNNKKSASIPCCPECGNVVCNCNPNVSPRAGYNDGDGKKKKTGTNRPFAVNGVRGRTEKSYDRTINEGKAVERENKYRNEAVEGIDWDTKFMNKYVFETENSKEMMNAYVSRPVEDGQALDFSNREQMLDHLLRGSQSRVRHHLLNKFVPDYLMNVYLRAIMYGHGMDPSFLRSGPGSHWNDLDDVKTHSPNNNDDSSSSSDSECDKMKKTSDKKKKKKKSRKYVVLDRESRKQLGDDTHRAFKELDLHGMVANWRVENSMFIDFLNTMSSEYSCATHKRVRQYAFMLFSKMIEDGGGPKKVRFSSNTWLRELIATATDGQSQQADERMTRAYRRARFIFEQASDKTMNQLSRDALRKGTNEFLDLIGHVFEQAVDHESEPVTMIEQIMSQFCNLVQTTLTISTIDGMTEKLRQNETKLLMGRFIAQFPVLHATFEASMTQVIDAPHDDTVRYLLQFYDQMGRVIFGLNSVQGNGKFISCLGPEEFEPVGGMDLSLYRVTIKPGTLQLRDPRDKQAKQIRDLKEKIDDKTSGGSMRSVGGNPRRPRSNSNSRDRNSTPEAPSSSTGSHKTLGGGSDKDKDKATPTSTPSKKDDAPPKPRSSTPSRSGGSGGKTDNDGPRFMNNCTIDDIPQEHVKDGAITNAKKMMDPKRVSTEAKKNGFQCTRNDKFGFSRKYWYSIAKKNVAWGPYGGIKAIDITIPFNCSTRTSEYSNPKFNADDAKAIAKRSLESVQTEFKDVDERKLQQHAETVSKMYKKVSIDDSKSQNNHTKKLQGKDWEAVVKDANEKLAGKTACNVKHDKTAPVTFTVPLAGPMRKNIDNGSLDSLGISKEKLTKSLNIMVLAAKLDGLGYMFGLEKPKFEKNKDKNTKGAGGDSSKSSTPF